MGIQVFPAASGGGVKLVQRGQAVSAGSITITAVDITKTFVRSFSEGASGTVATNSTVAAYNSSVPSLVIGNRDGEGPASRGPSAGTHSPGTIPAHTITGASAAISGGTMDATTKQFGVHLVNSTTLTATGACRWEVVEFA
jgi:hypothetical protein